MRWMSVQQLRKELMVFSNKSYLLQVVMVKVMLGRVFIFRVNMVFIVSLG